MKATAAAAAAAVATTSSNKNKMRKIAVITLKNCKFHPEILDIVINSSMYTHARTHAQAYEFTNAAFVYKGKMKETWSRKE